MVMKKALKFVGLVIVGLLVVASGFIGLQYSKGASALETVYEVALVEVAVPTDAASIAEGQRLAIARGCTECHGADLGGKSIDMGPMGTLWGPNLTTSKRTPAEMARAIRHGVHMDGTPLILMPSEDYWVLSDRDVGMILAAIQAAPEVGREDRPQQIGPMAYVILGLGQMPVAAAKIDHDAVRSDAPPPGPTVEYGEYLANTCVGCHGKDLKGGIQQGPPGTPPSSNLTTALKGWTREDFEVALTQRKRPNGPDINEFMPATAFKSMTDVEFDALYAYLSSLPGNQ